MQCCAAAGRGACRVVARRPRLQLTTPRTFVWWLGLRGDEDADEDEDDARRPQLDGDAGRAGGERRRGFRSLDLFRRRGRRDGRRIEIDRYDDGCLCFDRGCRRSTQPTRARAPLEFKDPGDVARHVISPPRCRRGAVRRYWAERASRAAPRGAPTARDAPTPKATWRWGRCVFGRASSASVRPFAKRCDACVWGWWWLESTTDTRSKQAANEGDCASPRLLVWAVAKEEAASKSIHQIKRINLSSGFWGRGHSEGVVPPRPVGFGRTPSHRPPP